MRKDFSPELPINDKDAKTLADFVEFIQDFNNSHKNELPAQKYIDEIVRLILEAKCPDIPLAFWSVCQGNMPLLLKIFPFVGNFMIDLAHGKTRISNTSTEFYMKN